LYEECLNFIFRNEEFHASWKPIAGLLGLNLSLYNFAATENFNCKCSKCIELKDNADFKYYIFQNRLIRKNKKIVQSKLMWVKDEAAPSLPSYISEDGRDIILFKSICSNHYFQMMQAIRKCPLPQNADHFERILSLEARMGHIDYTLLEPETETDVL
jgi:hypothetical protein